MATTPPPTEWLTRRNTAQVVLCLVLALATFVWSAPSSYSQQRIGEASQYIVQPLGLWQAWGIFASPPTASFAMRLASVYSPTSTVYTELIPQRSGYSWSVERGFYFNLLGDSQGVYIDHMLSYYCNSDPAKPTSVRVEYSGTVLPQIGALGVQPDAFTATPTYQTLRTITCIPQ